MTAGRGEWLKTRAAWSTWEEKVEVIETAPLADTKNCRSLDVVGADTLKSAAESVVPRVQEGAEVQAAIEVELAGLKVSAGQGLGLTEPRGQKVPVGHKIGTAESRGQ